MAANPPGKCCTMGHLHKGEAKGELKQFGGVESYIIHPSSGPSKKVVYFLTDVFGHKFVNSQLVADAYAQAGYTCVMPDLFNNDAIPPEALGTGTFDLPSWLKNHSLEQIEPIVEKVLETIKSEFKPEAVGAVGYCFGAKFVTRLLNGKIQAGFNAHPSFVSMEELAGVKGPLSIAAAETDSIFTTELRHESEKKLTEIKATFQINLYSKTEHGFAIRGDDKDKWVLFAKEQAFKQAITWFDAFL